MKKMSPVFVFVVSAVVISLSSKAVNKKTNTYQPGFALVELFTSEGCSSCPSADNALEEVQKKYNSKNVIMLGYHVDYWNRLGWKDIFSDAVYTARQEYYADLFRLSSIYTPQVVVNGLKEFIGSDKNKLIKTIDEQLGSKTNAAITIKASQNNSEKLDVTYSTLTTNTKDEKLILLLVQKTATNKIIRGENEGKTLHHINIVRELTQVSIPAKEETTSFKLPPGLKKEDVFIAAFLQNKKTGRITGIQSSQTN